MIGEEVIAKAFGALLLNDLQDNVLTFDQFMEEKKNHQSFHAHKVDLNAFHQLTCVNGMLGNGEAGSSSGSSASGKNIEIVVKTLTGKTFKMKCNSTTTIDRLRMEIHEMEGIPPAQQRLIFAGRQLQDGWTVGDYKIIDQSTLQLVLRLQGGGSSVYYIPNELLCPRFDFDFTGTVDTRTYTRGRFTYKRPCGWNRIALNVLDKYENNVWIGAHRKRTTAASSLVEE